MYLEILTPDKSLFSGSIKSLTLPGTKSPFTVLRNHAPLISTLEEGDLCIVTINGDDLLFTVGKGVIEVNKEKIMVLVETVRTPET